MTPTVQSASRTDSGLASELRLSVMRLSRRLRSEREPDNTLSVAALSALGILFREGECTVGALAAHERVQPPSMTRTVNGLVEEGYAESVAYPPNVARQGELDAAEAAARRAGRGLWPPCGGTNTSTGPG